MGAGQGCVRGAQGAGACARGTGTARKVGGRAADFHHFCSLTEVWFLALGLRCGNACRCSVAVAWLSPPNNEGGLEASAWASWVGVQQASCLSK